MRFIRLVALLLTAMLTACDASPTATLRQPGVGRVDSNPPPTLPDTASATSRGGNGFGSGN
jgi:hypothetical protein